MDSKRAKYRCIFASALGLCVAFATPAFGQKQVGKKFQPLNIKPGLWQTTTAYRTAGAMTLPPGELEKMTPQQRAQVAQMKGTGQAQTISDKHCVTQDELQNPFTDKHCTWTILESTGSSARGTVACEEEGMQLTGSGQFQALDQEHINGSAHLASASGGGPGMTTDATFTSKWLGANCGNVR